MKTILCQFESQINIKEKYNKLFSKSQVYLLNNIQFLSGKQVISKYKKNKLLELIK